MADTHAPQANPQTATTNPKSVGTNLSFDCVLEHELGAIAARRAKLFKDPPFVYDTKARAVDNVHLARPLGVAFSGGGIRSATFNLGLLQGLAERGLLKYADYLSTVSGGRDPRELVSVFQALTRKWYAPPPVELGDMSRLNDEYSRLIQRLADTKELWDLVPVLVLTSPNPPQPKLTGDRHMFIVEVIQLMENVYTEFKLEHEMNRANPRNAGWMRVFRRWAQQQVVRDVWDTVKENYNTLFRAFMDQALLQPEEDMPPRN